MRFTLLVTLGLYATLGSLCPMHMEAATLQRESHIAVRTAMDHAAVMHGESAAAHTDCGEEDHCTLGERVDGAHSYAAEETSVVCMDVAASDTAIVVPWFEEERMRKGERPPPLPALTTVVLRL